MINISQKDKSIILLIAVALVFLWLVVSIFFTIYNKITFNTSDLNHISLVDKGRWFNVVKPLQSSDIEGKIIVMHFWSYSCSSCIESIEKLKELDAKNPDSLVIIGVHNPIFDNEKNYNSVKKAVIRHEISYPVINDSDLELAKKFNIKNNPSFLIFGLSGRVDKKYVGSDSIDKVINRTQEIINKNKFSINHSRLPIVLEKNISIANLLTSPTKIIYEENFSYKGREFPVFIIANSGQNSVLISNMMGEIVLKIGSGIRGMVDGDIAEAKFSYPQGILYGNKNLYIADTGNNSLRFVDFETQKVKTIIGSGEQGEVIQVKRIDDAKSVDLSAPTDLEFFPDKSNIAISNSGTNQILIFDIKNKTISILAGNGDKGEDDGVYPQNSLAQTADMAVYGNKLYFLDGLTSNLRVVNKDGDLKTLYSNKSSKKLQNPRGLIVDDTGVYISDSFNHVIRKYDFNSQQLNTLFGFARGEDVGAKTSFDEPSGLVSIIDKLYVVDANNNRILAVNRARGSSTLLDLIPPQKLYKETFVEYLPNLQKSQDIFVKSEAKIELNINIDKGWKINQIGPSFINLLELKDEKNATLIASYDWNAILQKKIYFLKLKKDQEYLLQGKIYFCRNELNSLCYIKSYEQKIIPKDDSQITQIEVDIGQ
jgi:thiol-disulfide isomerase/thioredoxin/DNA-binding beta-propeller fold protein YncE